MTANINLDSIRNATVFGSNGEKIGKVGEVYLDDSTEQPTFATVNTGLFGMKETFVPLDKAQQTADGLTVPFDKEFVKDAPNIDADGNLTPEEEQRIYEYYQMGGDRRHDGVRDHDRHDHGRVEGGVAGAGAAAGVSADHERHHNRDGVEDREALREREGYREHEHRGHEHGDRDLRDREGVAGRGAAGDNDVVAHEEHLRATGETERRETGRMRLRKHVVTDRETVEVPVRREEVHIEREKIDPNSAEARVSGDRAFQGDGEETVITTHEERPVVGTETVATERVSLDKDVREDTERVSGEVRREEIDIDEAGRRGEGRDGRNDRR
ncbi:PRC and DUF2382 domain-containing protein [Arthrobacter sp. UM1]|uniref:PRC and DUF2382 domain-containing protein n=1 Tax=Arthrobacter sp. UM1 TaxID=2766776 RepID=UPI001CF66CEB|nr:PRC and DUF2382 domain-containing protein [Arthrobacter sp. UM1]MCB4209196.1 PRC and DUF2382 domain-containing protein [Arthrobacter sp. UM1]